MSQKPSFLRQPTPACGQQQSQQTAEQSGVSLGTVSAAAGVYRIHPLLLSVGKCPTVPSQQPAASYTQQVVSPSVLQQCQRIWLLPQRVVAAYPPPKQGKGLPPLSSQGRVHSSAIAAEWTRP
jgi:hypothetical protein